MRPSRLNLTSHLEIALAACGLLLGAPGAVRAQVAPPNQDYVASVGASPLLSPATVDFAVGRSFTMEGWFYRTADQSFGSLMGKGLATVPAEDRFNAFIVTDPFNSFGLHLDENGNKLMFTVSTGVVGSGRSAGPFPELPLYKWTHVACVMDDLVLRLFVNGSLVATGAAVGSPIVTPVLSFGVGLIPGYYRAFPGYARQVRFWNVARTALQISTALHESLPAERTGLVAAWPLDESAGATARDMSGASRRLTAPSGAIVARSSTLLASPFYSTATKRVTDDSLFNLMDGVLIDFDSDGDADAVTLGWENNYSGKNLGFRALRNNAGTFVDVTDTVMGTVVQNTPSHSVVGDFNGDGRPDLFVAGGGLDAPPFNGEQSTLLIQTPDGRLVDETATRLPRRSSFTHSTTAADIDGDGDLDIYMGNIAGLDFNPRFYLNNGRGFFTEALDRLPPDVADAKGGARSTFTASLLVDINMDGRPDLVLGGSSIPSANELLLNDGRGFFVRDKRFVMPPKLFGPQSTTAEIVTADFNDDGKPDLLLATSGGRYVTSYGQTINGYGIPGLQLLLNRGDGTFVDSTGAAGFSWRADERWVRRLRVVDLDGDGRPDLIAHMSMASEYSSWRIFLNRGAGRFVDATEAYAHTGSDMPLFIQAADFDRDGKMDILTVTPEAVTVARNLRVLDPAQLLPSAVAPSRLANLSVLTSVTAADPVFTVGTVVGGAGTSGTKPLLIRAAGPSLTPLGVGGALPDPKLDVFAGATVVAGNDNWSGTPALTTLFSQVGAFAFSAATSRDAAVSYTPSLTGGLASLTMQVSGVAGATGAVIAELYDATPPATFASATPRLINVSVLKQIGTGNTLTAGFVIQGLMPKQVLIRAVGPTLALAPFGVGGAMPDPKVELFFGPTVIVANDNWGGTPALAASFANVGAFPLSAASRDAALLVTLQPGNYTAQVSGVAGSSGLALVEIYEVQ